MYEFNTAKIVQCLAQKLFKKKLSKSNHFLFLFLSVTVYINRKTFDRLANGKNFQQVFVDSLETLN